MTELDDLTIIDQIRNGDIKAFEHLVTRYQRPIFNVVLGMVKDADDAKDITQVAYLKAYEKLDGFNSNYKFFSWICRIAVNEAINVMKKRSTRKRSVPDNMVDERTPEVQYSDKEISETVEDAIAELPLNLRAVVILRHLVELPYSEIGQILDIPEKTVKWRLYSGRQLLGEILADRGIIGYDR